MCKRAVVLLSGGQDSTTCLYWAMSAGWEVSAIAFNYGQRHSIEVECARKIAKAAGVSFDLLDIGNLLSGLADSDLVKAGLGFGTREDGLPSSFVPGRNILFLSIAGSLAKKIGANRIVTGVCETDFSGYPDCRSEFIESMETSLALGLGHPPLAILTPLMWMNKRDTWVMAEELGIINIIVNDTHTCYEGDRKMANLWGYGCGQCPACVIRERGYNEYAGR